MNIRKSLIMASVILGGAVANSQTGSTAYNFLEIPTSAQAFGLGNGAIALVDDDVNLVDQNPALIGPELEKQVSLSYLHYLGSTNFASLRYGMGAGEHGAWSLGIRYLDYGEITATDAGGVEMGSYRPQDIVFDGAYSHDFNDRLRGGIAVKMIYSNYEQYSAFALATDLGLNYYNDENDLSLSFVVKNLGGQLKRFDQTYDRLPIDVQLGYMQGLGTSPFSLAITATHLTKWNLPYYGHDHNTTNLEFHDHPKFMTNLFRHLIFGLRYQSTDNFYINFAYNYKTRTDMGAWQRNFLSGFSAGLGLNVRSFRFGVAYSMPHKSASSIMLNIGVNLDELLR